MNYLDFMSGYKTISGVLVVVLSTVLANYVSQDDVLAGVTAFGQLIGAALALYGLVMKGVKAYKNSQ